MQLRFPATRRGRTVFVFAVALAIALWHRLAAAPHAPHDYFDLHGMPWSDALHYHLAARDLLDGWGLRENSSFPVFLQAVRGPGYVLFLSVVYAFGGGPGAVALLQLILYAIACALTYRIAARMFGEHAGLIAAFVMALSRTQLDFATMIMTETIATVGGVAAVWLAVRDRPRLGWAGLLLGVAATARPLVAVLAPILAAHAAWRRREHRRAAAFCLALAAVPLLAISTRNAATAGAFSPAATYHIWTTWSEFVPPHPDSDDRHFTAFVPLLDRPEKAQRAVFSREVAAYVRAEPRRWLRRVWHLFESNLRLPEEQRGALDELVILPLFLLAAWGATRARDRRSAAALAAYAALFLGATALAGESSGRFRVPVDFALIILVTGGLLRTFGLQGPALPEPAPAPPWPRAARLGAAGAALLLAAVPTVRALRAPAPERIELDPERLGAESIRMDEYIRALFTDPSRVDKRVVAWPGVIDALAHFAPGAGDPRSALTTPRRYGWTLCTFQVDGQRGPLDGLRVFLEVPDDLGWRPPSRARAVVKARIETNLADPSRERPRLVATGVTPL